MPPLFLKEFEKCNVKRLKDGFQFISTEEKEEGRQIFIKRGVAKTLVDTVKLYQSKGDFSHGLEMTLAPGFGNQIIRLYLYVYTTKEFEIRLQEVDIYKGKLLRMDVGILFTPRDDLSKILKLKVYKNS